MKIIIAFFAVALSDLISYNRYNNKVNQFLHTRLRYSTNQIIPVADAERLKKILAKLKNHQTKSAASMLKTTDNTYNRLIRNKATKRNRLDRFLKTHSHH